jgi:hypothetical protein
MKINEQKLCDGIKSGKIGVADLRRSLAGQRNNLSHVTAPTPGAFSHDLNKREVDAAHNVPILENALRELGDNAETYNCSQCGKQRASRTCEMCATLKEY